VPHLTALADISTPVDRGDHGPVKRYYLSRRKTKTSNELIWQSTIEGFVKAQWETWNCLFGYVGKFKCSRWPPKIRDLDMTGVQWDYEEVHLLRKESKSNIKIYRKRNRLPTSSSGRDDCVWVEWHLHGQTGEIYLRGEGMNPCVISKTDSMATLYLLSVQEVRRCVLLVLGRLLVVGCRQEMMGPVQTRYPCKKRRLVVSSGDYALWVIVQFLLANLVWCIVRGIALF
jgi:hypothetical protein